MFQLLLAVSMMTAFAAPQGIQVSGECLKSVMPDRGSLQVTAVTTHKDMKSALKASKEKYAAVAEKIKRMNFKNAEMATNITQMESDWDYSNNKRIFRGYISRLGFIVSTSEVERLSDIVDAAASSGIQEVGQFRTFLSPAKQKQEYEACLQAAIANARAKAESMAKSLGVKVGAVEGVTENRNNGGGGVIMQAQADMAPSEKMAKMEVFTAPESMSVAVDVVFKIH